MRKLLYLFFILPYSLQGQTKSDSIERVSKFLSYYDLSYTNDEIDSMLDGLSEYTESYRAMHKFYPANSLPYPLAFHPVPQGMTIPKGADKLSIRLAQDVSLPKDKNELASYSVAQLASLVKNKKISSVELTRFFIDRLKKWGDTLECVISLTEELAMQQARQADEELSKGKYRGLLHGIPYGLKDLFAVKGTLTTYGSAPYKDQVIDEDSYVYNKLREAGAILCAKLSLGSLAYDNRWFGGFTRNPWNLQQGSSGSSAGSAAATAAGLVPFAIGTETWGSIVSPSNRCGVTGLRPTFGSVSRSGGMVLCWSLDKIGPICRTAEDAAIIFSYIEGTDGKDPGAVDMPFTFTGKRDISKMKIAYAGNYFRRLNESAPEWKVLEQLRKKGAIIQAVEFPDSTVYGFDLISIILASESAAAFDELTRTDRDSLIERQDKNFWPNIFRAGRTIPAVEYINANRLRYVLSEKINEFMKNYDAVIVPSFAGRQLAITNLTGHPVLVMPIGFNQRNLPVSISVLGNLYDEESIIAVGEAYQSVTDNHLKIPPKFRN